MQSDNEMWRNFAHWIGKLSPFAERIFSVNEVLSLAQNCLPLEFSHLFDMERCAVVSPVADIDRLSLNWIRNIDDSSIIFCGGDYVVIAGIYISSLFEGTREHSNTGHVRAVTERILVGLPVRDSRIDHDLSSFDENMPYGLVITASMTGNCGDKLLAYAALKMLEDARPNLKWLVADPAIDRQLVANAEVVVLGPGGYLYDLHNLDGNALYYQNIGNFFRFGFLAEEYSKPLLCLGLGYQGVVSKTTTAYVSAALKNSRLITTRDRETAQFLLENISPTFPIIVGCDLSVRLREDVSRSPINRADCLAICGGDHIAGVDLKLVVDKCSEEKISLTFIIQANEDVAHAERWALAASEGDIALEIQDMRHGSVSSFIKAVCSSSLLITSRFHGMMIGYMADMPTLVIGEQGDKRHRFCANVQTGDDFRFTKVQNVNSALKSFLNSYLRSRPVISRQVPEYFSVIDAVARSLRSALVDRLSSPCLPIEKMPLTAARQNAMETDVDQRQQLDDLSSKVDALKQLVNEASQPNINALSEAIRNVNVLALNVKFFGYELARAFAAALPVRTNLSPTNFLLKSKASTQEDLESDWVAYWASQLKVPVIFHRKLWELCYAMQAFYNAGVLAEGKRGLGFGCGTEPLPSLIASYGAEVVVTDLHPEAQNTAGWANTNQHTQALSDAYKPHLVSKEVFERKVSLEYVDMNAIPSHLRNFDFCWSICALEHLGSIQKGLAFIENSIDVLRSGGIAVHTTEFNFSRDDVTFDNWNTVLFQRRHFEELTTRLERKGYRVSPLDFDVGNKPLDKFIDVPPFPHDMTEAMKETWGKDNNHIKVSVDGIPSTCFGLIIQKP